MVQSEAITALPALDGYTQRKGGDKDSGGVRELG